MFSFKDKIEPSSYGSDISNEDNEDDQYCCKIHNYEPFTKVCLYSTYFSITYQLANCPSNKLCFKCLDTHQMHPGLIQDTQMNIYKFLAECQKLLSEQQTTFSLLTEQHERHQVKWAQIIDTLQKTKQETMRVFDELEQRINQIIRTTFTETYSDMNEKINLLKNHTSETFMNDKAISQLLIFYNYPNKFLDDKNQLQRKQEQLELQLNEFFIKTNAILMPFEGVVKDFDQVFFFKQIEELEGKMMLSNFNFQKSKDKIRNHNIPTTLQLVGNLIGNENVVRSCIQLDDGDYATASRDKSIRIWCQKSQICKQVLKDHLNWIQDLIVLPGNNFCSCSDDKKIKIYSKQQQNGENQQKISLLSAQFQKERATQSLTSASIKEIEIESQQSKWSCVLTLVGHESYVMRVIYNAFNNILTSCSTDGSVKLWSFSQPLTKICQILSNSQLAIKQEVLSFIFVITNKKYYSFETLHGHENCVYSLSQSKNENLQDFVVSGDEGGDIIKWSTSQKQIIVKVSIISSIFLKKERVGSLRLQDGFILSCGDDKRLIIWDNSLDEIIKQMVVQIKFTYNNQFLERSELESFKLISNDLLLAGDEQGYLILININKGDVLFEMPGHKDRIYKIEYYPQERLICTSSADHTAKLWKTL